MFTPWDDNELQFARLLCELVANCDDLNIEAVAESMDLTVEEVDSLFDRADSLWEAAKNSVAQRY